MVRLDFVHPQSLSTHWSLVVSAERKCVFPRVRLRYRGIGQLTVQPLQLPETFLAAVTEENPTGQGPSSSTPDLKVVFCFCFFSAVVWVYMTASLVVLVVLSFFGGFSCACGRFSPKSTRKNGKLQVAPSINKKESARQFFLLGFCHPSHGFSCAGFPAGLVGILCHSQNGLGYSKPKFCLEKLEETLHQFWPWRLNSPYV